MNLHDADIKSRLSRFLTRKQIPRRLDSNPSATDDEIAALVAAIARNAPRTAERLAEWWPAFEAALGEVCGSMWPTEKEIRDAAQSASKTMQQVGAAGSATDQNQTMVEAHIIAAMIEFFARLKRPLPGYNSAHRTAVLIRRGVLHDEREARFFGFELTQEQTKRALSQRPRKEEWDHHIRVMARLKSITRDEAERIERAEISPGQLPAWMV